LIHFEVRRARRGRLRRNQWIAAIVATGNHHTLFWSETYNNHDDAVAAAQHVIDGVLAGTHIIDHAEPQQ
jgi:hypothetical protein